MCLQTNMYQQGLQLTVLKVLSTTQSVPNAYTVNCPNGAIESVCIGALTSCLLASSAERASLSQTCCFAQGLPM